MKPMKPKQLKPLKALGPVHAKPLHHGAPQADGTGASEPRLRARGLFYADVAAALGWGERKVSRVLWEVSRWEDSDLARGYRNIYAIGRPVERLEASAEQRQLWAFLKDKPENHPPLKVAYYSKADGKPGKQPGTVAYVYYCFDPEAKDGGPLVPVDVALAVLNDRYEVIAS